MRRVFSCYGFGMTLYIGIEKGRVYAATSGNIEQDGHWFDIDKLEPAQTENIGGQWHLVLTEKDNALVRTLKFPVHWNKYQEAKAYVDSLKKPFYSP